ncbi:MAG: hypothetical protein ACO1NW_04400 [Chitinophagaceae bacterium]
MKEMSSQRKRKPAPSLSTIRETVMGVVIIVCAAAMFFREKLGLDLSFLPEGTVVPFAAVILLYGAWRIFRGIKSYKEDHAGTEE